MNDNKLSTNLSTIDTAVSRMRTSLGASNLDINKLADKVAEVKASLDGLESDMVYEVASREAMTALKGIQDGSACLVKGTETRGIKKWDKFVTINFPDRITLNTPLAADEVINIGIKIKGTGHGTLTGSLSATSFIFGVIIKGQGASAKSITYTAQGNTYVRTDSYGSPITSAGELQWDDSYAFDDRLSQFFVAEILLEETNIYYKNSWVPVNAGETLELKMTTAEQAATILEQTTTNNRLNADLAAANTTIQQQELTIAAQENTITLKDAEIAALNARIEELEGEQEPEETLANLTVGMRTSDGSDLPEDFEYTIQVKDASGNIMYGGVTPDAVSGDTAFSDLPEDFVVGEQYTITALDFSAGYEIVGSDSQIHVADFWNIESIFTIQAVEQPATRTLLENGELLPADTILCVPMVEEYEHTCNEINDLDVGTQLVYFNDANTVLGILNIENMGMTMVEVGSSNDGALTYYESDPAGWPEITSEKKIYLFDSGMLTNHSDVAGEVYIKVNSESTVHMSEFYLTHLQDIIPIYKVQ